MFFRFPWRRGYHGRPILKHKRLHGSGENPPGPRIFAIIAMKAAYAHGSATAAFSGIAVLQQLFAAACTCY
jgi:hypothetical protein